MTPPIKASENISTGTAPKRIRTKNSATDIISLRRMIITVFLFQEKIPANSTVVKVQRIPDEA